MSLTGVVATILFLYMIARTTVRINTVHLGAIGESGELLAKRVLVEVDNDTAVSLLGDHAIEKLQDWRIRGYTCGQKELPLDKCRRGICQGYPKRSAPKGLATRS